MLREIFETWKRTKQLSHLRSGIDDESIKIAEEQMGYPLPDDLKELYRFSNGADILDGNLVIFPVFPNDNEYGLTTATILFREWGWLIPKSVSVVGSNGSDEMFGVWLNNQTADNVPHPVIEFGEIFEPKCMSIVGTSVKTFLQIWTSYYLVLLKERLPDQSVFDIMNLPNEIRYAKANRETLKKIIVFFDPLIPDHSLDPYSNPLDEDDINKWILSINHLNQ